MGKNAVIAVVVGLVIVAVGVGLYVVSDSEDPRETTTISTSTQDAPGEASPHTTVDSGADSSESGMYVEYDPASLQANSDQKHVLFFHASWCPTCRALEKDINANLSSIPDGLTIHKVDYDSNIDLRRQYGVTVQHTLVQVDASGSEIDKWVGLGSVDEIVSQVQ